MRALRSLFPEMAASSMDELLARERRGDQNRRDSALEGKDREACSRFPVGDPYYYGCRREPARAIGRLAMAGGLAQLEWSAEVVAEGLAVSPLRYPTEPGLHAGEQPDL